MSLIEEALRRQREYEPVKPPPPPPCRRIRESEDKPSGDKELSWWRKTIRWLYMSYVWPSDMDWTPENQIEEIHKWAGSQEISAGVSVDKISAFALTRMLDGILKDAPNYIEMRVKRPKDDRGYIVTIVKPNGKTPHETRIEAERERDELKARLESIKAVIPG